MRKVLLRSTITLGAALALTSTFGDAHAQGPSQPPTADANVTLTREAPFDKWCVAPLCTDAMRRPALVKAPAFIAPNPTDGYLEQQTKRALSDALESAAKATLGPAYNKAVADVAEAIAATVTTDKQRLEKLGGLGVAIIRGALAYHLARVIETDPRCVGARRIDAIYSGLGITASLMPLDFVRGGDRTVTAACVDTAKRTARAVDQAVLRTIVSDALRAQVDALVRTIEAAKKSCADLPHAASDTVARLKQAGDTLGATTVTGAARALVTFAAQPTPPPPAATPESLDPSAPPTPPPSPAEQACKKALDELHAIPSAPLDALAKQGLGDATLAPLVDALRAQANEALALVVRIGTGAVGVDDLQTLVKNLIESLADAAGLSVDAPVLRDAIQALPKAVVVEGGSATVDPNAIIAFLAAQYGVDDDGKPSLRSLLGLKATPFVFELNGGIPNVNFSQQKFVGDATIGYSTKKFGIVGRGWVNNYDINDSKSHNDYLHTGGSIEAWWLSGDGLPQSSKLRLELRLTGGFDYYDTTTYPFVDSLSNWYDFDSRLGRGTGFVGIRYGAPYDRVSFQLLAGGGFQYEDPQTSKYTAGNLFDLNAQQTWTAQGSARLLLRVHVVPQIFGVRLRGDSTYFSITREQISTGFAGSGGVTTTTPTVEQQQQIELHGRLFLDADVASFGGFVPAVFGGIDYLGISGSATSTSTAVPVLGIGIVRQSW